MSSLPSAETVTQIFKSLLRRGVTVTPQSDVTPPPACSVGIYKSGDGTPIAACIADLALSAYSAAAFSLIPCRVAEESIRAKCLEDGLDEIFGEVLNVLSRLFTSHESHRITLMSTSYPPAGVPDSVKAAAAAPGACYEIDIDGYGSGRLSLFVLNPA